MMLEKPIVRVGNSAGVILPREWLHGKARVILVAPKLDIKKDILKILAPYLEDILGIYLSGSYARGEEEKDSDVDIIAVSGKTTKIILTGKYHIEVYPLKSIKSMLQHHPILIYPRLIEAKPIMNLPLLEELKCEKMSAQKFKEFFEETKRILKIDKEFLEINKLEEDKYCEDSTIYSLILRLRGFYMINCILSNKIYTKKGFFDWLRSKVSVNEQELKHAYKVYKKVRDDKRSKEHVKVPLGKKLYGILKKECELYDKQKKNGLKKALSLLKNK